MILELQFYIFSLAAIIYFCEHFNLYFNTVYFLKLNTIKLNVCPVLQAGDLTPARPRQQAAQPAAQPHRHPREEELGLPAEPPQRPRLQVLQELQRSRYVVEIFLGECENIFISRSRKKIFICILIKFCLHPKVQSPLSRLLLSSKETVRSWSVLCDCCLASLDRNNCWAGSVLRRLLVTVLWQCGAGTGELP